MTYKNLYFLLRCVFGIKDSIDNYEIYRTTYSEYSIYLDGVLIGSFQHNAEYIFEDYSYRIIKVYL